MTHRIHFNFQTRLERRTVLRGLGVTTAMPWLNAMSAAFANEPAKATPKRFVSMTMHAHCSVNLGRETAIAWMPTAAVCEPLKKDSLQRKRGRIARNPGWTSRSRLILEIPMISLVVSA